MLQSSSGLALSDLICFSHPLMLRLAGFFFSWSIGHCFWHSIVVTLAAQGFSAHFQRHLDELAKFQPILAHAHCLATPAMSREALLVHALTQKQSSRGLSKDCSYDPCG